MTPHLGNHGFLGRAPRTLTPGEQALLLAATAQDPADLRDHVIFSVALGTGLREHEILALEIGDVFDQGRCRRRIELRVFKGSGGRDGAGTSMSHGRDVQEVLLPDAVREKLTAFRVWKEARGEDLSPRAPLFVSQRGLRLSARQVRHLFHIWQAICPATISPER